MPAEITVPRLGWSMEEGVLTEWLKRDGEWVERGEMLFVLEGDKAAQEIESFESGVLRIPPDGPRPGDSVKVGQVIGFLVERGVPAPFEQPTAGPSTGALKAARAEPVEGVAAPPTPAAGPDARRLARELGVDLTHVTGSGRGGRIVAGDVRRIVAGPAGHHSRHAPSDTRSADAERSPTHAREGAGSQTAPSECPPRRVATPRARRVARELGIDWTGLGGTGRAGRVRECDVRAAAADRPEATGTLSSRRRVIADRMVAALRATAPVTLTSRASATNLLNLRDQFKAAAARPELANADSVMPNPTEPSVSVPSITDLLVKIAAVALARHPEVNARWQDDRIVESPGIHIGVAVDDASGLIVPVVHDVPRLGVRQVGFRLRELIAKARAHRLTAAELSGGTFTVTNLGMLGIDVFTPILHSPQTAILGIGAIRREPVVTPDDRVIPGDVMTLNLTFDHRVIDGAPAARFLQTLVEMIESPAAWLVA